jgi:uncharacterized protein (DUF924 family)
MIEVTDIVTFWRQAGSSKWFKKRDAFDAELRQRFEAAHHAAARRELAAWRTTAEGTLGLVLLLDQIPRNIWRNSAHAFATDALARQIAAEAVDAGHDQALEAALRPFFYLPFEHSEALADQARSMALCRAHASQTGDTGTLKWAIEHHDIIARFGRFPHRNAALGRPTRPDEQAFLEAGGFAG